MGDGVSVSVYKALAMITRDAVETGPSIYRYNFLNRSLATSRLDESYLGLLVHSSFTSFSPPHSYPWYAYQRRLTSSSASLACLKDNQHSRYEERGAKSLTVEECEEHFQVYEEWSENKSFKSANGHITNPGRDIPWVKLLNRAGALFSNTPWPINWAIQLAIFNAIANGIADGWAIPL